MNRFLLAPPEKRIKTIQEKLAAQKLPNLLTILFVQILCSALCCPLLQKAQANGVPWYTPNWLYRKPITIAPITPEANYQLKVTLTPEVFDYAKAKENGEDIRFTGSDGTTLQDYWIEQWNNHGTSIIWVEVKDSGSERIYIYYGNSDANSTSNGFEAFEKRGFDDFEIYNVGSLPGQTPATDLWTEYENNPVLNTTSRDGFSSVLKVGDTYHMYYSWVNVRHATSPDGKNC